MTTATTNGNAMVPYPDQQWKRVQQSEATSIDDMIIACRCAVVKIASAETWRTTIWYVLCISENCTHVWGVIRCRLLAGERLPRVVYYHRQWGVVRDVFGRLKIDTSEIYFCPVPPHDIFPPSNLSSQLTNHGSL